MDERHESWGNLLIRELEAAFKRHGVEEAEIEAFNKLGITPLLNMDDLLRHWAIPVAGTFSYATLATCSVEMLRRALAGDSELSQKRADL